MAVAPALQSTPPEGLVLRVRVGTLFTVTFSVLVSVQPAVLPDTVYVVDTVGLAVVVPEVEPLGIQL